MGFFFGTKTCGQISMCQHADPGQMATQLRADVLKEIGNIFFWFNYNRFPRDSIYCWHVVLDGKMNTIKLACLSLHSPCFHPLTSFLFLLRAFSLSSLCLPFNCCAPIYFPSFICLFIYLYPIFLQLKAMLKAGHNIITCAQHNSPDTRNYRVVLRVTPTVHWPLKTLCKCPSTKIPQGSSIE